eukprot:INCI18200.1.p1 GENE.INCI18200.1~~INCI18200.1.p1  ORF type:complete len:269 (-),score=64.90 INCI18200.1:195-1001(-)
MSQKVKRKAVEEVTVTATTVPVDSGAEVDVVAKRAKTSADDNDKSSSASDNVSTKDLDAVLDEALRALSSQEPSSATAKVTAVTAAPVSAVGTVGGTAKPDRMSRWETNFSRLISYIAEHGNARVPQSFHSEKYPKLGKWVSRQRDAYRNEQLRASGTEPKRSERIDESQIARLNALNFEWVIPGRKKKNSNSSAKPALRKGLKASVVASAVPVSAAPVKATAAPAAAPATAATAAAPAATAAASATVTATATASAPAPAAAAEATDL